MLWIMGIVKTEHHHIKTQLTGLVNSWASSQAVVGKELNLNYSLTNAKEQSTLTSNNTHKHFLESWQNAIRYCQHGNDWLAFARWYNASAWHIDVMSWVIFNICGPTVKQGQQVRSSLDCCGHTQGCFCAVKGKSRSQLFQGRVPFVFIPCVYMCDVQSACVLRDREMCECVSERRKERSDEATRRGVGPRMARQRKR